MQKLMIRVQDRAREIRSLQDEVPKLKAQLAETKYIQGQGAKGVGNADTAEGRKNLRYA